MAAVTDRPRDLDGVELRAADFHGVRVDEHLHA
jgi:hypothetical protein